MIPPTRTTPDETAAVPLQSRTLAVGAHELAVHSVDGPPDGPVFVLVHGLGMSHRYLDRLQRELSRTGATHCVDLPGFGGTRTPTHRMSVADGASALGSVLDRLSLTPVVLVGHSMGGQFATELAAQRPSLVSHLVLVGPVTDPGRAHPLAQATDLARDALLEPPSGNALTFTDFLRCGPRWYLTELVTMLRYRTDERIGAVQAPTLVVRGADDPVSRSAWGAQLVARAADGTLVEIPRHRHLVQYSAAAPTAEAVVDFARR